MRIENKSPFKTGSKSPGYRIENKADDTTMYLYDEIGYWGVTAKQFVKDLEAVKSKNIHLRINSPGGSVFDGTSIYNALKQHPANVVVHIDGLAASISSIIALAGNEIRMSENAFFMIHEPWSMVIGSSDDMRKEADLLDKVRGMIAATYMKKSKKEEKDVLSLMAEETWMTASEALEMGFIDAIDTEGEEEASVLFDLSAFMKVPEKLQNKEEKELTAREVERILRDAGCPVRQSKAIVAEGFKKELRDVAPVIEPEVEGPLAEAEVLRDVVTETKPPSDLVNDLLIRAELMAPNKPQLMQRT